VHPRPIVTGTLIGNPTKEFNGTTFDPLE